MVAAAVGPVDVADTSSTLGQLTPAAPVMYVHLQVDPTTLSFTTVNDATDAFTVRVIEQVENAGGASGPGGVA